MTALTAHLNSKPPRNVDTDEKKRVVDGEKGLLPEILSHFGTDHLDAPDGSLPVAVNLVELFLDLLGKALQLAGDGIRPNQELVVRRSPHLLDGGLARQFLDGIPDGIGRGGRVELDLDHGTAGEIDAHVQPTPAEQEQSNPAG